MQTATRDTFPNIDVNLITEIALASGWEAAARALQVSLVFEEQDETEFKVSFETITARFAKTSIKE